MAMPMIGAKVPSATRIRIRIAAEEKGESISAFTRQALEERADRVLGIDRGDHPAEEEGDGED